MLWVQLFLAALALLGHAGFCVAAFNRLHAVGLPRGTISLLEKPILLYLVGLPPVVVAWLAAAPERVTDPLGELCQVPAARTYFWFCFGVAALVIGAWIGRSLQREPVQWIGYARRVFSVRHRLGQRPCASWLGHVLSQLPGNQVFELEVNEKVLAVPHLPPVLDGLSIAHCSDLHFTGHVTKEFFHCAVEQLNALQADLVALTGDLLDHVQCLPWIDEVLGRIRSRFGTFCVLGNHDQRIRDTAMLRRLLGQAGLHHVGGRWQELPIHGTSLIIAGNELPWFGPAADLAAAPVGGPQGRLLRIVLAHTPDALAWARRGQVDLLLAGHTHGGQIRLPGLGPIVTPSRYGVRYASGVFYARPTLLHVSRGLSAEEFLRINCRPELTKLVLRSREPITVPLPTPLAVTPALALPQHGRCCAES